MRPYSFSMEKVLEWREGIEKEITDKLALKKNEIDRKNLELEELLKDYEEVKDRTRRFSNTQDLVQTQLYRNSLADQIKKQRGFLTKLHLELEETRKDLVKARKDKLAMERLKEKDYEKYREKLKHLEQEFLDEVASTRHSRKDN